MNLKFQLFRQQAHNCFSPGKRSRLVAAVGWALALAMSAGLLDRACAQQPLTEDEYIMKAKADFATKGLTVTHEQEVNMRLQYQRVQGFQSMAPGLASRRSSAEGGAGPSPVIATASSSSSRDDLARLLSLLPAPRPMNTVARKDGFDVDGVRRVDPEGRITRHSANPVTGDFVYVVAGTGGSRVLKRGRGADAPAFTFATVSGQPGGWNVNSVDGQRMEGDTLILSAQGVLVARDSVVFEMVPGQAVRSFSVPNGWSAVPYQRGDVGSTRYLFIERNEGPKTGVAGLVSLFKDAKRLVGTETPDDYQLLNIDTGTRVTLAIDISDKNVVRMSQCRRKNAVMNECRKADSYESLWEASGEPNLSHYYWRAQWMQTAEGPMAIVQQRGATEVRLFDLQTGKEVVAFRRALGIQSVRTALAGDGVISIDARWMFQSHVLKDARALLDGGVDMKGRAAETTVVAGQTEGSEVVTETSPTH